MVKVNIKYNDESGRDLCFYYFFIPDKTQTTSVIAYDLDNAIGKINEVVPEGVKFVFSGKVPVAEVFKALDKFIDPNTISGLDSFKCGLVYAADEFIKDENDKKTIKEIIEKI